MTLPDKRRKLSPPDPENYIWVDAKEGGHWRRKRGCVKPARMNAAYQQGIEHMKISAPAASRIIRKLKPYMDGLQPGRLNARISALLRKALNETGKADLRYLQDLDLQRDHPIEHLLKADVCTEQTMYDLVVTIPIADYTLKRMNRLVSKYFFELVLLYGDATKENGLRTESEASIFFEIERDYANHCRLSIVLPEQPWIALLKLNCIEGDEPAANPNLYGMKVIAGGCI